MVLDFNFCIKNEDKNLIDKYIGEKSGKFGVVNATYSYESDGDNHTFVHVKCDVGDNERTGCIMHSMMCIGMHMSK